MYKKVKLIVNNNSNQTQQNNCKQHNIIFIYINFHKKMQKVRGIYNCRSIHILYIILKFMKIMTYIPQLFLFGQRTASS